MIRTFGSPAFVENPWIGGTLEIGDVVRLRITLPTPRFIGTDHIDNAAASIVSISHILPRSHSSDLKRHCGCRGLDIDRYDTERIRK